MKKFCVFSGFLGSGKTTTMMALARYYSEKQVKAAMISNDLGHGVNLADHRLAQLSGCDASELTGECICYINEILAERLNSYFEKGCDIVISDIPGFGVGTLEHVYHGLTEKFPGVFALAPFTVLVEPETVEILRGGRGGDLTYILDTQLVEADLIVLNKCDTLDEEQKQADLAWLAEHYPQAQRVAISARTGDGLEELSHALLQGRASLRRPDIGYCGEAFTKIMSQISEYYLQYRTVVCCSDFDGTAYLTAMAERVRGTMKQEGYTVPHLKLLAWSPEGDYGKVDYIGEERPTEKTKAFERPCTDLAVLVNATAVCPGTKLDRILTSAVESVSEAYQLELMVFKKDLIGNGQ